MSNFRSSEFTLDDFRIVDEAAWALCFASINRPIVSNQMTSEQIIGLVSFSIVAAITPGPSNVMVAVAGSAGGFLRGLSCLVGVAAGMASLMFAVAVGMGSILQTNVHALFALKLSGATFLLWLSWKIATADAGIGSGKRQVVGLLPATLFQWINPKSWIVSAGAVSTYFQPDPSNLLVDAAMLSAVFLGCAVPCLAVWLLLGASLERFLTKDRSARAFNRAMAALLTASIVLVFV